MQESVYGQVQDGDVDLAERVRTDMEVLRDELGRPIVRIESEPEPASVKQQRRKRNKQARASRKANRR